jgi:hypothetical protein
MREFLIEKNGEVSLLDIQKCGSNFRSVTDVNVVTPCGCQLHNDSGG